MPTAKEVQRSKEDFKLPFFSLKMEISQLSKRQNYTDMWNYTLNQGKLGS